MFHSFLSFAPVFAGSFFMTRTISPSPEPRVVLLYCRLGRLEIDVAAEKNMPLCPLSIPGGPEPNGARRRTAAKRTFKLHYNSLVPFGELHHYNSKLTLSL